MIDVRTEQLLPLKDLPGYLESRGYGIAVSMRVVRRWIRVGCEGACLEVVRIDGETLTSLDAVQRWVAAQNPQGGRDQPAKAEPVPHDATPEHTNSIQLLREHRVVSTDLDRVVHSLPGFTRPALGYAAGLLFRAGLRNLEDLRKRGLDRILAMDGVGACTTKVVRAVWDQLNTDRTATS
ncbi:MAG: hypothetical protein WAT39_12900 [Planctomycetota bacterium]